MSGGPGAKRPAPSAEALSGLRLLRYHPPEPAADESRDIRQHQRKGEAAGAGEIARLPDRVELVLVVAQALEVVEVLAVAEDQGAETAPQRRDRPCLQACQGRHAEIEPLIS